MSNLEKVFNSEDIVLSEEVLKKFEEFRNHMLETNKFLNLTSITEEEEVNYKHFLDSILPLKKVEMEKGATLIDIGTGGGFPGMPIKFFRDDLKITLLDSLNKRIKFLKKTISDMDIKDIEAVHGRAEELGRTKSYREQYDYGISRAVSRLNTLVEYSLPFIKVGGTFISMKGPSGIEEAEEAKNAIKILGGEIADIISYNLDYENSDRTLIVIKKTSPTPRKYPRGGGKPKNKPL
ncbi:16S rRNA (guanine(527)-N(7))-methyltransferase RsmG [Lagierella sp.]|uniref:16S rRNA (guanine(527)-N(7))-methyltransferase RsmG n=1 Tax=Lagierella sp. TaxID=2849657 RepID=UPI00262443CF|nr:16S rRNA (guanine(527)-N(7))-methyltransferase RsmG [Lagierella sp.]